MIDWPSFFANGGYSNENSDPLSYDDGEDYYEDCNAGDLDYFLDEWDYKSNNYSRDD